MQRIPSLLNEVHRLIAERGVRFALLGSSARKLKTAGTNLLAGRALRKAMHPLTPAELGDDFSLDEALRFGTIPLVWTASDRREVLESYTQLYLREEIRAEAAVRNLGSFVRFLPVAALMHAQTVNAASLARDAGIARSTVNGYLEILTDTLLATQLPAFEARLRVRERRRPKLYWADPGLVRAVKRQLGPVAAEERGPLLEGWVLGNLRAHNEHQHLYDDIGYWAATESTAEVDFVLTRDRLHLAIEVKAAERYNTTMGQRAARHSRPARADPTHPHLPRPTLVPDRGRHRNLDPRRPPPSPARRPTLALTTRHDGCHPKGVFSSWRTQGHGSLAPDRVMVPTATEVPSTVVANETNT